MGFITHILCIYDIWYNDLALRYRTKSMECFENIKFVWIMKHKVFFVFFDIVRKKNESSI